MEYGLSGDLSPETWLMAATKLNYNFFNNAVPVVANYPTQNKLNCFRYSGS